MRRYQRDNEKISKEKWEVVNRRRQTIQWPTDTKGIMRSRQSKKTDNTIANRYQRDNEKSSVEKNRQQKTTSHYPFGICWLLCCLSSSTDDFSLSLWYLLAIVLSVFFDWRLLIIPLVSFGHCVVCLLRLTTSHYPFGIFWPLYCLSSSIDDFSLSLCYLLAIVKV
jgi:hypothetical protein